MPSRRRTILRRGAGVLFGVAAAGCNTTASPTDPAGQTPTPTGTATDDQSDGRYVVDATLDTAEYLVWGFRPEPGRFPYSDAVSVASMPSAARTAVDTAISEGTYTTDDPDGALLSAVDGVDLVRADGTDYTLSHTFTEYVLNWRPVTDDDVDDLPADRVVDADADVVRDSDAVATAVDTVAPRGTHNPSSEYRRLVFPEALESFLDRYDYVRTNVGVGRLDFHVVRQFPPYTLSATAATEEQRYGREVLDATGFTPTGRDLLERAIQWSPRTPLDPDGRRPRLHRDSVPVLLADRLDDGELVRLDDSVYHFQVRHRHWAEQPFALDLGVPDDTIAPNDPAALELSATNERQSAAVLTMPGLLPFGLPWATRIDDPDGRVQLWSDRFEDSDLVTIEDGVARPDSYQHELSVVPGETVARTYQFGRDTDALTPGRYRVPAALWARWPPGPDAERVDWLSRIYPYDVTLDVEPA